jgi:hypothetical protein
LVALVPSGKSRVFSGAGSLVRDPVPQYARFRRYFFPMKMRGTIWE